MLPAVARYLSLLYLKKYLHRYLLIYRDEVRKLKKGKQKAVALGRIEKEIGYTRYHGNMLPAVTRYLSLLYLKKYLHRYLLIYRDEVRKLKKGKQKAVALGRIEKEIGYTRYHGNMLSSVARYLSLLYL
ncbi:hypothetical protein [Algoriphagus sanaruensis]|uniref:Uncharacterized protein n=1 Tax=Algoriphagus sanaruensis TaxID=1727163 RepID=A0A142EIQ1_9BACT|nr:hypothetical protein [Algoriphagus sanaruensis]AMQ55006.1 hypothetical protein AO498_01290 [Algoriphagus sanaruensis]